MEIRTDYTGVGKIQYLLGQKKIPVLQADYTDIVALRVILPVRSEKKFCQDVTEATNGKAEIRKEETLYYAELDGRILMGEEMKA